MKDDDFVVLDDSSSEGERAEDDLPLWSRVFGGALALLVINLLWNDPIAPATGGGLLPFLVLNLAPSAGALALIFRRSRPRDV